MPFLSQRKCVAALNGMLLKPSRSPPPRGRKGPYLSCVLISFFSSSFPFSDAGAAAANSIHSFGFIFCFEPTKPEVPRVPGWKVFFVCPLREQSKCRGRGRERKKKEKTPAHIFHFPSQGKKEHGLSYPDQFLFCCSSYFQHRQHSVIGLK